MLTLPKLRKVAEGALAFYALISSKKQPNAPPLSSGLTNRVYKLELVWNTRGLDRYGVSLMRFRALLALSFLPFLTSCWTANWNSTPCPTVGVKVSDPRIEYTEHYTGPVYDYCMERKLLKSDGEPYQGRNSIFVDDSCFSPLPDESYSAYFARLMETLQIYYEDTENLTKAIESKIDSNDNLEQQLLGLKEVYRDLMGAVTGAPRSQSVKVSGNPSFQRYIVKKGDTLQKIAYELYSTHTGWINIYRFNIDNLPNGPNQIEIGQVLLIPQAIGQAR